MKTMKKIFMFMFGLLAIASCSNDDDETAGPATQAQLEAVTGHWHAELPISGDTDNWRTEEEGDVTVYDKVAALFYLNGYTTTECWWGYLYLQYGDMVNYGGIDLNEQGNMFSFTMTNDGYITPSQHLANGPKVSSMHYDAKADIITADVDYSGHKLSVTFTRPTAIQTSQLNEYFDILQEEGIVGGYEDKDSQLKTDVTDDDATEQQRARQLSEIAEIKNQI